MISGSQHYTKMEQIPMFGYDFIMADPPWLFELRSEKGEEKSAQSKYSCMTIDQIRAMRVGDLAASTGCYIWLWCTSPMIREGFSTLDAWGFKFVSQGAWIKRFPNRVQKKCGCPIQGGMRWGPGYTLRSTMEPFIIGRIGSLPTADNTPSGFDGIAREHSRKPEEGYALAEKMILIDQPRRLDLFSRQARDGWDSFGDEIEKFDPAL